MDHEIFEAFNELAPTQDTDSVTALWIRELLLLFGENIFFGKWPQVKHAARTYPEFIERSAPKSKFVEHVRTSPVAQIRRTISHPKSALTQNCSHTNSFSNINIRSNFTLHERQRAVC